MGGEGVSSARNITYCCLLTTSKVTKKVAYLKTQLMIVFVLENLLGEVQRKTALRPFVRNISPITVTPTIAY